MKAKLTALIVLTLLILTPPSYATDPVVMFEGKAYTSVDAVIAANFEPDPLRVAAGTPILHCTPKTTKQILQRGSYDWSADTMHCFRTEAEKEDIQQI